MKASFEMRVEALTANRMGTHAETRRRGGRKEIGDFENWVGMRFCLPHRDFLDDLDL